MCEGRGRQLVATAVVLEKRDGREGSRAPKVCGTYGAVGQSLKHFAIEQDHFTVESIERAKSEVAGGEHVAKRRAIGVVVGREGGQDGELDEGVVRGGGDGWGVRGRRRIRGRGRAA